MASDTRTCHSCGTVVQAKAWCPTCTDDIPKRPDPAAMTPDERVAEMQDLYGPLEVESLVLHGRIEALVGRPVWMHELPRKAELIEEARVRNTAVDCVQKCIEHLPEGIPTILVVTKDGV